LVQLLGVAVTYIYAGGLTFLILKVIGLFGDLRLTTLDEDLGMDQSQHGEEGYTF
jgi:ammonium transporter, Amt family